MITMPRSIRASLLGFLIAFLCEAIVVITMLCYCSLSSGGLLAVFACLIANPLALYWALKRQSRGYGLLKWIAAGSLLWTIAGGVYLNALGLWAIALIAACVWVRVIALLLMRRSVARQWIIANVTGSH
ncbi:hypothetical protein D0B32_30890 [Paraburkholderia sp. DHOC27]|nr:hypothetical protein D0B32_30890 [Paraburkholderia sp. DHOC27]